MRVVHPKWKLKIVCPVCEQGDTLTFLTCPNCKKIILACEEEGTLFPDPKNLNKHVAWLFEIWNTIKTRCPHCNTIDDFSFSKGADIQAIGFESEEIC